MLNVSKNFQFSIFNFQLSRGFTLIELVVALSVAAILSVSGVFALVSYSRTQTINAAAGEVSTLVTLAKSRASSQIKPPSPQCLPADTLKSYEIKLCGVSGYSCLNTNNHANSKSYYQMVVNCGTKTFLMSEKKLPSFFMFDNFSPSSIVFPVLVGGILGGSDKYIDINQVKNDGSAVSGGLHRSIKIDTFGNVTITN